ncbi:hypothetical protein Daesc_003543 [Daldinia eschscholtzii]|uniref:RRM domain-containing protein n=1 Tax=Daldinia eschscholtzii TaxID=292717 RepID=A0AAX6MU21_9PEZI
MATPIPTMDHRYFKPSEQLTGAADGSRKTDRCNGNYRGDCNLSINRGTGVPEERNTSLWITGLPGSTTVPKFLASITKTGRVRSTVINGPNESTGTAAASISFFRRKDAEVLYNAIQQGRMVLEDMIPRVQWNRNRIGEEDSPSYASRVLLIAGDPLVVNQDYLDGFFKSKFVYDIDDIIDHGTVPGIDGPISRLEYRFGSWRSQASFARLALNLELRGFLLAEYGEDPCAV